MNDQFGVSGWESYLSAIERARPVIEVLGVTDYYSIGCYRGVRQRQKGGRLSNVALLFPNIEMRLELATEKKRGVNLHLLFSPADDDHEAQIERLLGQLAFRFKDRTYRCNAADHTALGRAFDPRLTDDLAARREGANQYKVTREQLHDLFAGDAWVRRNCVVAVSASSNDGLSGLQNDGSFAAWRQDVERLSQVIFSGNPKDREFWLGRHPDCDESRLEREWGGLKPCLHGCDAHHLDRVGAPDGEKYCWIKGDPTFESLRQAILEPGERVWVGSALPARYDSAMCVTEITTHGTPWLTSGPIAFNSGLVAIIGSRGSGKTALADILAVGANVPSPLGLSSSFLSRASHPVNHLAGASVDLSWGDGSRESQRLCPDGAAGTADGEGRVRYLSQQFVEHLCSADGLADDLRREIERVIFDATGPTERLDADSFAQLAAIYLDPIHGRRQSTQRAINGISAQVVYEEALHERLPAITKERDDLAARIEKTKAEMRSLMPKGQEERTQRLADLEAALVAAATAVDKQRRVLVRIDDLQTLVNDLRSSGLPNHFAKLRADFPDTGLTAEQWEPFLLGFSGDVDEVLATRRAEIDDILRRMTVGEPGQSIDVATVPPRKWHYSLILDERDRVKKEVGIDTQKQRRYLALQRSLGQDERAFQRAVADLKNAEGASGRKQQLVSQRRAQYAQVFQSFLDEQQVLRRLYEPLQKYLVDATGALNRLRFSVSREIDLQAWVSAGEDLFDLRKDSRLKGHGSLYREAESVLLGPWKTGSAEEVAAAMQQFIQHMAPEFKKAMNANLAPGKQAEWWQQVAAWIYSTDHIEMRYNVTYDGVAIEHLSPGTRGIVLLLLYLVIDRHDQRPLIIDQPEENLDPKSVFDELVPHFREACRRRQVIIITHNANLVVNTDADQVIVASSERRDGAGLPTVSYRSGSLENPDIRKAVCDILEGGERAFRDRERRYRIGWESFAPHGI